MATDNIWMRALAILGLAAVLVGDGLALAIHDWSPSDSDTESPAALEGTLPGLRAFVEEQRGLKFKKAVDVDLLSDEEFAAELRGDEEPTAPDEDLADDKAFEGFLRALGLVHGPIDLAAAAQSVEEEGIVGFYDPERKRLFVRGGAVTPFVKQVLVHELTHALDDQYFKLDRPSLDRREDESSLSFRALVEGSAVAVEEAYLDSLSPEERDAAIDEEESIGGPDGEDIPEVVAQLIAYPYIVGPRLVEALIEQGGRDRLDRALTKPPVTSEQVLHPDKFLANEKALTVSKPAPDGEVVDKGVLGEAVLFLVLEGVLPTEVAREAAAGWGGDQYVAWSAADKTCLKWNLVMDSPEDTAEVVSALRTWESENPGATVRGSDTITISNCG